MADKLLKTRPIPEPTPADVRRFVIKIDIDYEGCWEWQASKKPNRYGQFGVGGRMYYAHRIAFMWMQVDPPTIDGLTLDHLCRNRGCVRPSHLEAVSNRVNVLRGETVPAANTAKTHCPRCGSDDWWRAPSTGWRRCLPCKKNASKRYRAKKRASGV